MQSKTFTDMQETSSRAYGVRRTTVQGEAHQHTAAIVNNPDQHAFVVLGTNTLFLCHLTMYGMEEHAYQLVVQARLAATAMQKFIQEKQKNPTKTYFIGNSKADLMTVPELQSGVRRYFIGDIFCGVPNQPHYDEWPWEHQKPIMTVPVTIERIVYFRHFAETFEAPRTLTYVLFGSGDEAHMTNCQTKRPDFDHILSLAGAPDWLPARQLEAGVHVSVGVHRNPDEPVCRNPLPSADCMVRYRGRGAELPLKIAFHYWFCTKVANDPNPCAREAAEPCASPP